MKNTDMQAKLQSSISAQDQTNLEKFRNADSVLLKMPSVKAERETATMTAAEYALIGELRRIATTEKKGEPVTRSAIVRAGLKVLQGLSPSELVSVLNSIEQLKPGKKTKQAK